MSWLAAIRYGLAVLLALSLPPSILYWFLIHPFIGFWRRRGLRATIAYLAVLYLVSVAALSPGKHRELVAGLVQEIEAGAAFPRGDQGGREVLRRAYGLFLASFREAEERLKAGDLSTLSIHQQPSFLKRQKPVRRIAKKLTERGTLFRVLLTGQKAAVVAVFLTGPCLLHQDFVRALDVSVRPPKYS